MKLVQHPACTRLRALLLPGVRMSMLDRSLTVPGSRNILVPLLIYAGMTPFTLRVTQPLA